MEFRNGYEILWKSGYKIIVPNDDNPKDCNVDSTPLQGAIFESFDPNNLKYYYPTMTECVRDAKNSKSTISKIVKCSLTVSGKA